MACSGTALALNSLVTTVFLLCISSAEKNATELSGSHGDEYEKRQLLGY
jgi:hypothetical protein